jgi:hypothetical protein
MKNLRKLGGATVLACVLSLSASAGEILTPPCAPPEPGQIPTPPCAEQQAPGDIETPTAESTTQGDLGTPTFTEIAADIILNFLPLF